MSSWPSIQDPMVLCKIRKIQFQKITRIKKIIFKIYFKNYKSFELYSISI